MEALFNFNFDGKPKLADDLYGYLAACENTLHITSVLSCVKYYCNEHDQDVAVPYLQTQCDLYALTAKKVPNLSSVPSKDDIATFPRLSYQSPESPSTQVITEVSLPDEHLYNLGYHTLVSELAQAFEAATNADIGSMVQHPR